MYRYPGLKIQGFDRYPGLKGLSIVILRPLTPYQQIVKAICRQIDKPHMPNITDIKVCQGLNNYPARHYMRRYIKDRQIPIVDKPYSLDIKGLDIFGYKGLKV
jgi:hypothetical protein